MTPAVSVVIPTYRRRHSVERLLEALGAQDAAPADYEAIVAIDGSEDGTRELLARLRTPFQVHTLFQEHRGRAAARNAGARASRGEILVFLDDDMEPAPAFVPAHRAAHPPGTRRGVVGAAPIPLDGASGAARFIGLGFRSRLERMGRAGYALEFKDVYTGNLSIRREVFFEIGGFDEDFALYGHEDYEFAVRLQQAGVDLVYCPEALVRQHYEKDFRALAADAVARGQTAVLFAAKHPDIYPRLKLATFDHEHGSRWGRLRRVLLAATDVAPPIAGAVVGAAGWLSRLDTRRADRYYALALDFCYWHGVRRALGRLNPARAAGAARLESPGS